MDKFFQLFVVENVVFKRCRDVDERYTPVQWIREMTPVILEMLAVVSVLIYAESKLLSLLL